MSTESLEQEIKYANLALGGNPAIQLSDRISSLLAVNKELLQALEDLVRQSSGDRGINTTDAEAAIAKAFAAKARGI